VRLRITPKQRQNQLGSMQQLLYARGRERGVLLRLVTGWLLLVTNHLVLPEGGATQIYLASI
jgi:hypothetical protein